MAATLPKDDIEGFALFVSILSTFSDLPIRINSFNEAHSRDRKPARIFTYSAHFPYEGKKTSGTYPIVVEKVYRPETFADCGDIAYESDWGKIQAKLDEGLFSCEIEGEPRRRTAIVSPNERFGLFSAENRLPNLEKQIPQSLTYDQMQKLFTFFRRNENQFDKYARAASCNPCNRFNFLYETDDAIVALNKNTNDPIPSEVMNSALFHFAAMPIPKTSIPAKSVDLYRDMPLFQCNAIPRPNTRQVSS
tara:strand:+ start:11080 stop:11826 length:747 start_codon:yes stop_codon:yes gene_type:complete